MIILLILLGFNIYGGNSCCRCNSSTPLEAYESKENEQITKRKQIETSVVNLPLPHILVLHLRSHTVDFNLYNVEKHDIHYFRQCVAKRFYDNSLAIDQLLASNNSNNAQVVVIPTSRIRSLRKQQRIAKHKNSDPNLSGDMSKLYD